MSLLTLWYHLTITVGDQDDLYSFVAGSGSVFQIRIQIRLQMLILHCNFKTISQKISPKMYGTVSHFFDYFILS
jgi:hypothetical protein